MNPFELLSISLLDVFTVVAHQNDKSRVFSTYIPKIFFTKEQPRVSRGIHFDEIRISTRLNPDIHLKFYELDPNDIIATNEYDSKSINSSYRINIIG